MNNLVIYRIITFILLPIAALLGFITLFALLVALANPVLFMGVFLLGSVVIYIYTSFRFYTKGIAEAKPLKHSLRDWIRVNAFVAIAFSLLSLVQSSGLLFNPVLLQQTLDQSLAMQQKVNSTPMPAAMMLKMMKGVLYFMLVLSILLLVHISFTFRFLKLYNHVFDKA